MEQELKSLQNIIAQGEIALKGGVRVKKEQSLSSILDDKIKIPRTFGLYKSIILSYELEGRMIDYSKNIKPLSRSKMMTFIDEGLFSVQSAKKYVKAQEEMILWYQEHGQRGYEALSSFKGGMIMAGLGFIGAGLGYTIGHPVGLLIGEFTAIFSGVVGAIGLGIVGLKEGDNIVYRLRCERSSCERFHLRRLSHLDFPKKVERFAQAMQSLLDDYTLSEKVDYTGFIDGVKEEYDRTMAEIKMLRGYALIPVVKQE